MRSDKPRHPCPRCGRTTVMRLALCRPCGLELFRVSVYEHCAPIGAGPNPPSEHGPVRRLTREEIARVYGK